MNLAILLMTSFQIGSGGMVTASGRPLELTSSEATIDITQDLASARVIQTYLNDSPTAEDVRYLFPLPHDAAVYAMTLQVGEDTIRAQIRRIEEAQAEYRKAKAKGQTAALLEEHRANVFTQDVGNVPPRSKVQIEIKYVHAVPFEDGVHRFHFPMGVGARYGNGANGVFVPELSKPVPVEAQGESGVSGRRTSVRVRLRSGMPIRRLASPTHPIEVDDLGPGARDVTLAEGRVEAAKDFVLEYALSSTGIQAGFVSHLDERGRFGSLLVEPPDVTTKDQIVAREVVFVLDASGSMEGAPLAASKRFVNRALDGLRSSDTFRLIVFGSSASELSSRPLEPTPGNLATARKFLQNLGTRGGTEIELGIRAALDPVLTPGRLRLVVFLTDGFIGDEASVLSVLRRTRGEARLFAFGVGPSTNRWLLEEMAVVGRGVSRVLTLGEQSAAEIDAAAIELADRLEAPIMTDAWVDFGGCPVSDVTPSASFDLFKGAPVRIAFRLPAEGCRPVNERAAELTLVGRVAGRVVRSPIPSRELDRPSDAIPLLWARGQIADRMRSLTQPARFDSGERSRVVEEIIELGLRFQITTQWTAFVAHTEGVAAEVTPEPAPGPAFGGSSAPEPAEWAAFLAVLFAVGVVARRRGLIQSR